MLLVTGLSVELFVGGTVLGPWRERVQVIDRLLGVALYGAVLAAVVVTQFLPRRLLLASLALARCDACVTAFFPN